MVYLSGRFDGINLIIFSAYLVVMDQLVFDADYAKAKQIDAKRFVTGLPLITIKAVRRHEYLSRWIFYGLTVVMAFATVSNSWIDDQNHLSWQTLLLSLGFGLVSFGVSIYFWGHRIPTERQFQTEWPRIRQEWLGNRLAAFGAEDPTKPQEPYLIRIERVGLSRVTKSAHVRWSTWLSLGLLSVGLLILAYPSKPQVAKNQFVIDSAHAIPLQRKDLLMQTAAEIAQINQYHPQVLVVTTKQLFIPMSWLAYLDFERYFGHDANNNDALILVNPLNRQIAVHTGVAWRDAYLLYSKGSNTQLSAPKPVVRVQDRARLAKGYYADAALNVLYNLQQGIHDCRLSINRLADDSIDQYPYVNERSNYGQQSFDAKLSWTARYLLLVIGLVTFKYWVTRFVRRLKGEDEPTSEQVNTSKRHFVN